jgi:hypothetical protein
MSDSIASRIKERSKIKERTGRVGGEEHRKLILQRKKEYELRKRRANRKIEC